MAITVKICGINSVEAADAVVRARADFAGLMFHPRSPRHLGFEAARALARQLKDRVRIVAVVSDAGNEAIDAIISAVGPDYLQLHGRETPERAAEIRARFSIPVIKSFAIADGSDLAQVESYRDIAELFLFDAKAPADAERSGGRGVAFDWQLLRGRNFSRPWLLAGGLTPDNVARAIATAGAPGVDASSGLETAPGRKSPDLIRAFVENARNAKYATETHA